MSATTTLTSRRWTAATVVGIVAMLLTLLVPVAARADAGAEAAFVAAANRERAAAGLPALDVANDLVAVARVHSARMADADDLHHNPSLASDVADWQKVGENVGRGPDVDVIHTAFMDSPGHRANILDGEWTQVGIGVEMRDGRVWVTQVFRLPAAAPPPAPEPATAPAETSPAPATTPAAEDPPAPAPQEPEAPAVADSGRSLVMLSRVAADDAALDAATD